MILRILTSVVIYFVLMYVSINLLGFLVRGLFSNPELDKLESEGSDFIKDEIKKSKNADKFVNIIALILIILFFYLLLHFWNIGLALVALLFMAVRLPDLLWEIRHGKKMTRAVANSLSRNILYYTVFLDFLAFPVLFYFLYYY